MTNSLTDSLKAGRSFDDKLYNYLKNESTEEKITFDDIYPVGSIVKNSIKEPTFKNGTWVMTGVYGVKYYDETPQSTNVKHKLEWIFNEYAPQNQMIEQIIKDVESYNIRIMQKF